MKAACEVLLFHVTQSFDPVRGCKSFPAPVVRNGMPDHPANLAKELEQDLADHSPDWCVTKWVLETLPYAFEELHLEAYWEWKSELARRLEVDAKNVLITGSAAAGVSLNPYKNLTPFGDESDIDVAVVSTYHFNLAWRTLRNLGSRYYSLTSAQQYSIREHRQRHIYWGVIATDRILPILPYAKPWTEALQYMSEVEPTEGRDVGVRVYRDVTALRTYLQEGIKKLVARAIDVSPTVEEIKS